MKSTTKQHKNGVPKTSVEPNKKAAIMAAVSPLSNDKEQMLNAELERIKRVIDSNVSIEEKVIAVKLLANHCMVKIETDIIDLVRTF